MQPEGRDIASMWDMANACSSITEFLQGKGVGDLQADAVLCSAIHWQVIVVGEAARRVSRRYREAADDIDWPLLFRQRNFYAHEYDAVDPQDLWQFVTQELPSIASAIRNHLSDFGDLQD